MQDETIRKPGRFVWRRSGNQYVCRFGMLSASVKKLGRKGVDLRWRVGSIFGNPWLGDRERRHSDVDDAILEAEALVIRQAGALARLLRVVLEDAPSRRRATARRGKR